MRHISFSLFLSLSLFLSACASPQPTASPAVTAALSTASAASTTGAGTATAGPATGATATLPPTLGTSAPLTPGTSASATPGTLATPSPLPLTVGYAAAGSGTPGVLDAVKAAAQAMSWTVQTAPTGGADPVATLAKNGAQLVIADGAALDAAVQAAATAFPKSYFIGVNQAGPAAALPNLLSLGAGSPRLDQLGFMAGVVAGYATRARVVTAVGYTTSADGLKYRNGFLHGVRYSCSRCRVDLVDLTDLNDGATAAAKARLNASLSSDVVFVAAGPAGVQALQAAAQAGAWVIGADADVYVQVFGGGSAKGAGKVLTSAYIDPGAAVAAALKAYQAGKPWTGTQPFAAQNGAVALAPMRVSSDVLGDLDRHDISVTLGRLADGALDTGIDPLTGNEL